MANKKIIVLDHIEGPTEDPMLSFDRFVNAERWLLGKLGIPSNIEGWGKTKTTGSGKTCGQPVEPTFWVCGQSS